MNRELLEQICLGLPGTDQDIKWENDLCYLVGGKMFAVTQINPPFKVSFKTSLEDFATLVELPGARPAPYLGRYQWVLVEDIGLLSTDRWRELLVQAHALVLGKMSKKKQKALLGETDD